MNNLDKIDAAITSALERITKIFPELSHNSVRDLGIAIRTILEKELL